MNRDKDRMDHEAACLSEIQAMKVTSDRAERDAVEERFEQVLSRNIMQAPNLVNACTTLDSLFRMYLGLEPDEARMRARETLMFVCDLEKARQEPLFRIEPVGTFVRVGSSGAFRRSRPQKPAASDVEYNRQLNIFLEELRNDGLIPPESEE